MSRHSYVTLSCRNTLCKCENVVSFLKLLLPRCIFYDHFFYNLLMLDALFLPDAISSTSPAGSFVARSFVCGYCNEKSFQITLITYTWNTIPRFLRTVPTKEKGFYARLGPSEKLDLCKCYWNPQRKIRVATHCFEIISFESQQKC